MMATSYSSFGRLQFELAGRIYGKGLLKVEPSALKRWLISPGASHDETLVRRLVSAVKSGQNSVMSLADELVLPEIVGKDWRKFSLRMQAELDEVRAHRLRLSKDSSHG
jgi:hypothetical protein